MQFNRRSLPRNIKSLRAAAFAAFEPLEPRIVFGDGWNQDVPSPTTCCGEETGAAENDPNSGAGGSSGSGGGSARTGAISNNRGGDVITPGGPKSNGGGSGGGGVGGGAGGADGCGCEGEDQSAESEAPVNYFTGKQTVVSPDIVSNAFGKSWGHVRTWTGLNEGSQNGNGWMVTGLPYLVIKRNQSGHEGIVTMVEGANAAREFDTSGAAFTTRYAQRGGLEYVPPTTVSGDKIPGEFRYTDGQGNVTAFYDLPRHPTTLVTGQQYGAINSNFGTAQEGYTQEVTQQWFDPSTGTYSNTATDPYRFGAFKSFTSASGALTVTATYDGNGNLDALTRTDGSTYERFDYTYTTVVSSAANPDPMLVSKVELKTGPSILGLTLQRSAEYEYYTGEESGDTKKYGRLGDLKLVTIKDHQPNASGDIIEQKYYRYNKLPGQAFNGYTTRGPTNAYSSFNATTGWYDFTSGGSDATFPQQANDNVMLSGLKTVVEGAAFARMSASLGSGFEDDADSAITPYANYTFEYERVNPGTSTYPDAQGLDTRYRVIKETAAAEGCSTCSGGIGTYTFSYTRRAGSSGYTTYNTTNDTNQWVMKTVERLPDTTAATGDNDENHVYTNELGQVVLKVFLDRNGTASTTDDKSYVTYFKYDDQGRLVLKAHPSAVTQYWETSATLIDHPDSLGGGAEGILDDSGLIEVYEYGTADGTGIDHDTPGDVQGFFKSMSVKRGETDANPDKQREQTYFKVTAGGATVYPVATDTVYRSENGGDPTTTSYTYSWFSGTAKIQSTLVTHAAVAAAENGTGSSETEQTFNDEFGRPIWHKDADGFLTYTEYDPATGAVTKQIVDVDTSQTSDFADKPSTWSTSSGGGLHLVTTCEVDELGRCTRLEDPQGNVTYTVYDDENHEVRIYRGFVATSSTSGTTTGPIEIHREYRPAAGAPSGERTVYTETLLVAVAPGVAGSVPDGTETFLLADIRSLSRSITNDAGQVVETDEYFSLTGLDYDQDTPRLLKTGTSNEADASNDSSTGHYHKNQIDYDSRGRVKRVESPTGTITRTLYDGHGRSLSVWVGTDDVYDADPTNVFWSADTAGDSEYNLKKVREYVYDEGLAGDGNLTRVTEFPSGAYAETTLPIANAGFGDITPPLADTVYNTTLPNGWQRSGSSAAGLWNPDSSTFPGLAEGEHVYWAGGGFFAGTLSQALSGVGLEPNTRYTLEVDVGHANGNSFGDYKVQLFAGSQLLAEDDDTLTPTETTFSTSSVTYTSGSTPPTGDLEIRLVWATSGNQDYVVFDNVRLRRGPADASPNADRRVTEMAYDWRNRLIASKSGATGNPASEAQDVQRQAAYYQYDNLGRVTHSEQYDGDRATINADANSDGVPDRPTYPSGSTGSQLRARTVTEYDSRKRVFRSSVFSIDPVNGVHGLTQTQIDALPALRTSYWYDERGNVMKTAEPGGLVHKYEYDGAGRLSKSYVTDGGGDTATGQTDTWNTASTTVGDVVLTQTENEYDGNGNVIFVITKDRFHDDATTTGALTATIARVSYSANYYDAADRLTTTVNAGTNGGSAYSRFASAATSGTTATVTDTTLSGTSTDYVGKTLIITAGAGVGGRATVTAYDAGTKTLTFSPTFTSSINNTSAYTLASEELITGHVYDDAGRVWKQIDPRGIETRTLYDPLGRSTKTIEAYVDGVPSDADDRTTLYTYDGSGRIRTLTADMPGTTPDQTTEYAYTKPSGATGSDINSNDLLWLVKYPDLAAGTPGTTAALQEAFTYNALGECKTLTDRNGNVHAYTYDVLDRVTSDTVTSLGTNVHGQIRRMGFAFDSAGRPQKFTSYATTAGTGLLNQVRREYNGLGQLTKEYQDDPNGGGGSAPFVEYIYGVDGGTNRSVLTRVKYPNGRVVDYNYVPIGGSSGLNDRISRLDNIAEGTSVHEGYSYLGLQTIVKLEHPETGIDLTYVGTSTGQYPGLDRFGRVIDQRWVKTSTGTDVDRFQYGYDRNGNRLYRDNVLNSDFDELYRANSTISGDSNTAYDALNRLKDFRRGALSASGNNGGELDTVATASRAQGWTLDALGNWSSVTTEAQSRQHNSQNQLTQVNGSTLTYDNNGKMIKDQNGNTLGYDAWNRLTRVFAPAGNMLVSHRYDARGRRIAETKLDALSGTAVTLGGGTSGNDTFRIAAGSTSGTLDLYRGTTLLQTVSGTEIILNGFIGGGGNDTINVEAGTVHIVTDFGAANVALNVTGMGTVVQMASDRQHLSSLSIGSGTTVRLQPGRQTVLVVAAGTGGSELSIASGGTLDVADNAVLVRSNAGNRQSDHDTVYGWTATAYEYGDWTGTGITSSIAEEEDEGLVGVGVIHVDLSDGDELALGILGEGPNADDVVVRFSYAGDATLNGIVDSTDMDRIDDGSQSPGADEYYNGDFNYDGVVDGADYGVIDNSIQFQAQGRLDYYTRRLYYSDQWQVLEERVRATLDAQQIWSPRYVDAMVLRDRDIDDDGAADDERLYVQQDANFNVTSVTNASGVVQERYVYDPYGTATVLDQTWANDADGQSDISWVYLHQGGPYDITSGLYHFRHRDYSSTLGRWAQQDPAGYVDGMGLFVYEKSSPAIGLDPDGLMKIPGQWLQPSCMRCLYKVSTAGAVGLVTLLISENGFASGGATLISLIPCWPDCMDCFKYFGDPPPPGGLGKPVPPIDPKMPPFVPPFVPPVPPPVPPVRPPVPPPVPPLRPPVPPPVPPLRPPVPPPTVKPPLPPVKNVPSGPWFFLPDLFFPQPQPDTRVWA